jgi:SAM-dependent methyltransferase
VQAAVGEIHRPPAEGLISSPEPEPARNCNNYRISDADKLGTGSLKTKCRLNLTAIETLKRVEAEGRTPTGEEKRVLVRYVGWGGIPQVFDPWNEEWQEERQKLESILTPEELESARATTLNAHYTSPAVVRAMWAAAARFGFEHGRILEPACGIGHFIGLLPDGIREHSAVTGIEIDSISARLARALYPDADIRHQPFEEAHLADGFYDLLISNIPFGDYKPYDPQLKKWNFVIHDYFFAATLAKTRPGGLILFVTSKGTLDKVDGGLREYVRQQAELLGAIRLPNDAFKRNANTEVTTDIVMLRRRLPGELPNGATWKDLVQVTNSLGEVLPINEYFGARPEMMLGEMRLEGKMYRGGEPTLASTGGELEEKLAQAIALLPKDVYQPQRGAVRAPAPVQTFPAPEDVKPNAYALINGEVAVREGDTMRMLRGTPGTTAQRIRGLVRLRDAVRRCLRSQMEDREEEDIAFSRAQLNQTYDSFVSKFGPVSERANASAFRGDPDLPLLLSLERYNPATRSATKAAIFFERTIRREAPSPEIRSPKDALLITLNARGTVDLDHLSGVLHCHPTQFLPELKGAVFLNPQTNRWETEDEYLSGNVRAKLKAAEAASLVGEQFLENVEALKSVQPADLSAGQIDARLGSTWVPEENIEQFARHLLEEGHIQVSHVPQVGLWQVRGGWTAKNSVANTTEWGTERRGALDLLEDALNLRTPTVYDYDERAERNVINIPATEAARDKQQRIKEKFKQWIWQDEERSERLARKYNEEFNNTRLRTFNGDHLTLPGASAAIRLRAHQKAAIWRILQTPNCLLAHVVGAGIMPRAGLCRVDRSLPDSGGFNRSLDAA